MLAYCDYIAHVIRDGLYEDIRKNRVSFLKDVMRPKMHLHPTEGYFMSTKKTLEVQDKNGKMYRVTVEEV